MINKLISYFFKHEEESEIFDIDDSSPENIQIPSDEEASWLGIG